MKDGNESSKISRLLAEKKSIAICLPIAPTLDSVAAGLAMYLALKNSGKSVVIACADPIPDGYNLPGQEHIQQVLSAEGDTLIVSIPFSDTGVDNVTYTVEGDRVQIVIKPEAGAARFNPQNVEYKYAGGKPDVIFSIYSPSIDALAELYTQQNDMFAGSTIVNIDRHMSNTMYGTLNFVDKESPSMCQMIDQVLYDAKIELTKDAATNILAGLTAATNNFTAHTANAQTFKLAGILMELGAERSIITMAPQQQPVQPQNVMNGQASGQYSVQPMQAQDDFEDYMDDDMYFDEAPASVSAPIQPPRPMPVQQVPAMMPQPVQQMQPASMPVQPQQVQPQQNTQSQQPQQNSHRNKRNRNRHGNRQQQEQQPRGEHVDQQPVGTSENKEGGQQISVSAPQQAPIPQQQPVPPQPPVQSHPQESPHQAPTQEDWLKPKIFQGNTLS